MAREPVQSREVKVPRLTREVKPLDRMTAVQDAVAHAVHERPEMRDAGGAKMTAVRGTPKGLVMTYNIGGRVVVIEATRKDMKLAAARGELQTFMADLVAKAL